MVTNAHRVIFVAANAHQAHFVKNLLADHDIPAYVSDESQARLDFDPTGMGGPGLLSNAPRVIVHEADAQRAREVAREAEQLLLEGSSDEELTQLEAQLGQDAPWPVCPHCEHRRLATCPVCETAGTDFPQAFLPDEEMLGAGDAVERLLVICSTCDEPFEPRFPARCEWCGHRFSDGYEPPPADILAAPQSPADEVGPRVTTVLIGLAVLLATIFGWFYYLLR